MEENYFKNEHLLIGNLGHLAVAITFGASLLALISFIFASKDGDQKIKWFKTGRWAFWVHGFATLAIVTCLFLIIKNHYFEYHYAWRHSSLDLPKEYMISCFWEGQEGSFLLWLFWQMVLGVFVLFKVNKWTSPVMVFIALSQVVLSSMLLGVDLDWFHFGSSPFELLRDHDTSWIDPNLPVYTMRNIQTSDYLSLIKDGNGLNPLLQNYWMVIHPPTLFLGFASTIVPFAFAMAALWKRNYKEWIVPALPWTLFSAAILGTGVIMGAMWAYESLSFGGFWAWDPVENASLVPWLTLVAGLHVMLIAKSTGHSLKEAFILITITFLLILYSTFLTRSGILQNTSVHAFTDDGLSNQLFVFMMLFVIINLFLIVKRWKEIPSLKTEQQLWSREFWMFIGSLVLVLSAMQIIFTTSLPVWNKIVTMTGLENVFNANVAPPKIDVYNRIQLPIAVLIGLLTAVTQFFKFKNTNIKKIGRSLLAYFAISIIITIGCVFLFKTYNPEYVTMLFSSIFGVVGNIGYITQVLKGKFSVSGASVGHIGFGLMLIGILVSTTGKRVLTSNNFTMPGEKMDSTLAENMLLTKNKPVQIGEYTATYRGDSNIGVNHYLAVEYEKVDTATNKVVEKFTLHPNAQANPKMGLVANPDTRHQDRGAGVDFDPARPDVRVAVSDGDGERLEAHDVLRSARQVDLAGRDHRGDTPMERRFDEVEGPLPRCEVAEDRVGVRVDEPRDHGRPAGVDDDVGVVVQPAPDRLDPPVADDDGIGVEERPVDVARDDLADPGDQRTHGPRLSARRLRRRRPLPGARRSASAADRRW